LIRNRGLLDLEIKKITVSEPDTFQVTPTQRTIAPGGVDLIEITCTPPDALSFDVKAHLSIATNDPDPYQNPFKLFLLGNSSGSQINVGEPLTDAFGFLDPSGGAQLEALEGNVVILAYFALF
jgi:hypothetical protein